MRVPLPIALTLFNLVVLVYWDLSRCVPVAPELCWRFLQAHTALAAVCAALMVGGRDVDGGWTAAAVSSLVLWVSILG